MNAFDTNLRFRTATEFKEELHNNSYLSDFSVSFSYIDNKHLRVLTLSTDYDWHLEYWETGLDKKLAQRTHAGVHCWGSYDNAHLSILKQYAPEITKKVDICTRHNGNYELLSFSSKQEINLKDLNYFIESKPTFSILARKIWKNQYNEIALPVRGPDTHGHSHIQKPPELYKSGDIYQFGDLILTCHEMLTIQLLIQLKSIKEIARYRNCSVDAEKRRIANIKRKLGSEGLPLSYLFDALKKNGVIFTCMAHYIMYP